MSKTISKKFIKTERRSFLKGAVVATGAAAVVPVTSVASESTQLVDVQNKADKGYKENDYIRNYYDRARF